MRTPRTSTTAANQAGSGSGVEGCQNGRAAISTGSEIAAKSTTMVIQFSHA
jgi:hypothetical protein